MTAASTFAVCVGHNPKLIYKMEYNTSQKKLILPEYGRHVHMMVQYAVGIENREKRNAAAYAIIGVMGNLQPHLRDIPDFKHKLWDHLFIMSEFKLDIDAPYLVPSPEELVEKPNTVPYSQSHIHRKYYGKLLVDMIREAGRMEDSELKDSLIHLLAAQMKKSYTAWNRNDINPEQIAQDLWDISDGKIVVKPEAIQLPTIRTKEVSQYQGMRPRKKRMSGSNRK